MEKQKTTDLDLLRQGHPFLWGQLVKIHVLPRYTVVEYKAADEATGVSETQFHTYVDGEDSNHSFKTLEAALVNAIALGRPERGENSSGWVTKAACKLLDVS